MEDQMEYPSGRPTPRRAQQFVAAEVALRLSPPLRQLRATASDLTLMLRSTPRRWSASSAGLASPRP